MLAYNVVLSHSEMNMDAFFNARAWLHKCVVINQFRFQTSANCQNLCSFLLKSHPITTRHLIVLRLGF